jgi:hypothetical protein
METKDQAPAIGDVVALPSGRTVMLTTAPYPDAPWIALKVRTHWEVRRRGHRAFQSARFAIGRTPAPGLDEADAQALAALLNAVRPAVRPAAGVPARKTIRGS